MGGEVSCFSASMIKLIWSSTQILFRMKPCLRSIPCIGFDSSCSAPLPATKSPFLLMTNQNQTSPAPHPQNQPPDSGSVHGSQRQQLWLSLHRSHRVRFLCFKCFLLIPQGKEAAQLFFSPHQDFRDSRHLKILG